MKKTITEKRLDALVFAIDNITAQTHDVRQFAQNAKLLLKQRAGILAKANEADEFAATLRGMVGSLSSSTTAFGREQMAFNMAKAIAEATEGAWEPNIAQSFHILEAAIGPQALDVGEVPPQPAPIEPPAVVGVDVAAGPDSQGVVLKYGEAFMCTGEHAVGDAYLMSCAEAAIMRKDSDKYEIGHALARYAAGDMTLDQAIAFMNEDLNEEPEE